MAWAKIGYWLYHCFYLPDSFCRSNQNGRPSLTLLGPVIFTLYSVACYIVSSLVVKESGELDLLIIVGIDKVNYLVNRFVPGYPFAVY